MFERLDFQTPRQPDESSHRFLRRWQSEICTVVQERWKTLVTEQVKLSPVSVLPITENKLMPTLDHNAIGAHFEIGSQKMPSMLVASGRLNLTLVENVLNIKGDEWPTQRSLSAGEIAILEILYENFNDAIQESWGGRERISSRFVSMLFKPSRARVFAPGAELVVFKFRLETQYGEEHLSWLTSKQQIEDLISADCHPSGINVQQAGQQMTELTERMPAEIIVQLGLAELRMSEALKLESGDVVLLDQSVRKPLTAYVENRPKWKGQPVTVGTRIAFQVTSLIEE